MKQIPLTQGKFAIVDDEDYDLVNKYKWFAHKNGNSFYAVRNSYINGKRKDIKLHRMILNIDERNILVDHINFNGLDNRRENIRICTKSQNAMNMRSNKNTSSIYKGVFYRKNRKKWTAKISANGKQINIGTFINEIEAAKAYDVFALQLHKEFANTNF